MRSRRFRLPIATLAVAFAAALGLLSSAASGAESGSWTGRVGVAGHLMWYADTEQQMETLRGQGVTWTREDFLWSTIQPTPGAFDWSWPDKLMTNASRKGFNVLGILGYSTSWSSSDPGGSGVHPPRDLAEYAAYASAVARRYGPGGTFWAAHPELAPRPLAALEIWNEPWGHWNWKPNPDPAGYARLARAGAEAIHAASPEIKVLMAGDLLQARTDGRIVPWLANILAADPGLKSLIDAYSVHPYPYPRQLGPMDDRPDPRWDFQRLRLIHDVDPTTPIWITEIGWSTAPGVDDAISEEKQAAFVRGAVDRALGEYGSFVERVFVYSWDRSNGTSGDREGNFGLRRANGSAKPAWQSLSDLIASHSGPGSVPPAPPPSGTTNPARPSTAPVLPTLKPSFGVQVSPGVLRAVPGTRAGVVVALTGLTSLDGPASVSVSRAPVGVTVSVATPKLNETNTTALVVFRVGSRVKLGSYRITIRASAKGVVKSTVFRLAVVRSRHSMTLATITHLQAAR